MLARKVSEHSRIKNRSCVLHSNLAYFTMKIIFHLKEILAYACRRKFVI